MGIFSYNHVPAQADYDQAPGWCFESLGKRKTLAFVSAEFRPSAFFISNNKDALISTQSYEPQHKHTSGYR